MPPDRSKQIVAVTIEFTFGEDDKPYLLLVDPPKAMMVPIPILPQALGPIRVGMQGRRRPSLGGKEDFDFLFNDSFPRIPGIHQPSHQHLFFWRWAMNLGARVRQSVLHPLEDYWLVADVTLAWGNKELVLTCEPSVGCILAAHKCGALGADKSWFYGYAKSTDLLKRPAETPTLRPIGYVAPELPPAEFGIPEAGQVLYEQRQDDEEQAE